MFLSLYKKIRSWIVSVIVNFFLLEFSLSKRAETEIQYNRIFIKATLKSRICEESSKSLEG